MSSIRLYSNVICGLAVLLCTAPGILQAQASGNDTSGNSTMDAGSSKMMKSADMAFAMKAAQGGMAEVQMGQLALQKSTNPQVKAFAQRMVDDHTKMNDQLKSVAAQENMTLPTSLDAKDSAMYTRLQNESGAKFDDMYMKGQVKDHETDIKEFQKEANSGKNPQLKSLASQSLPMLQSHLQDAKKVDSSLTGKQS